MTQVTGMRFYIPINVQEEREDGTRGSQTVHIVQTNSFVRRTNKRHLMEYFRMMGEPEWNIKCVMKSMGFWGAGLGMQSVLV